MLLQSYQFVEINSYKQVCPRQHWQTTSGNTKIKLSVILFDPLSFHNIKCARKCNSSLCPLVSFSCISSYALPANPHPTPHSFLFFNRFSNTFNGWFRLHDSQIFLHDLTVHTMQSLDSSEDWQHYKLCIKDSKVRCSRNSTVI